MVIITIQKLDFLHSIEGPRVHKRHMHILESMGSLTVSNGQSDR